MRKRETIICTVDYTRKFELARWYVDVRNSYAVNAEIPEGPPEPIDDGFGLGGGGMPAQDSAAQATTLAQMTAEQQIGEEGRLAGMLRRLRGMGCTGPGIQCRYSHARW